MYFKKTRKIKSISSTSLKINNTLDGKKGRGMIKEREKKRKIERDTEKKIDRYKNGKQKIKKDRGICKAFKQDKYNQKFSSFSISYNQQHTVYLTVYCLPIYPAIYLTIYPFLCLSRFNR